MFFIGYILFEVPCNVILKRIGPRIWLPSLTLIWGIVATLMGIVQNLPGFFVARFFLGIAEGGLFPGVVFFLSMWYKRQERQYRVALFFSAASLAGAFGGILAYVSAILDRFLPPGSDSAPVLGRRTHMTSQGIAKMNGVAGQGGWRWIFILVCVPCLYTVCWDLFDLTLLLLQEGLFTVVIGALAFFFIPNYPSTAKFLTENEKTFLQQRLSEDSDAGADEGFKWDNVLKVFKDPKCWLYCAAFHTMSLPLYTLSLFLVCCRCHFFQRRPIEVIIADDRTAHHHS